MKKILALILVVVMALSAAPLSGFVGLDFDAAPKASAYYDDYEWEYEETFEDGYYTYAIIDEKAIIVSVAQTIKGAITVPSTLGGYPVTTIGYMSFAECDHLTTVDIPSSVTTIESDAFNGCDNITDVSIPTSVKEIGSSAFYKCTSLITVNIPEGITTIHYGTFRYCENLISVTLPSTLKTIDDSAFYECSSLTAIDIPDSVESVGSHAFYECYSLTSVKIGRGVELIEDYAFAYCYCLNDLTFVDGVKTIEYYAFYNCSGLTTLVLPEGTESVGEHAFADCDKLTSITLPSTVSKIYVGAFGRCDKLETISVSESNVIYCDIDGVLYTEDEKSIIQYPSGHERKEYTVDSDTTLISEEAFYYSVNLETVNLPAELAYVSDYAFADSYKLKTVTFAGTKVESLGYSAFYDCYELENIVLPNGLKTIMSDCFSESGIKKIAIPSSVTNIGDYAFEYSDLEEVTLNEGLQSLGQYAFAFCDLKEVYIPSTVINISKYVFRTYDLEKITVSENNEYFTSDDTGTLYNKDKSILVQYPIGNERVDFQVPETVLRIKDGAFTECQNLRTVVIPDGVSNIGANAFESCYSLSDITIPESVTGIGYRAFSSCDRLADVYYTGSEDEWKSITLSEENDELTEARIHYNYGESHSVTEVKKQRPNCGEWGVYAYSCSCGYTYEKQIPPEGEHLWNEWYVDYRPTCEDIGEEARRCEVCGKYEYREIPALGGGHEWGEWFESWFYCSDGGEDYRYCSKCNEIDYRYVEASGEHEFGEWELKRAANCGTMGRQERVCSKCDYIEVGYLPVIGEHQWTDWYDHDPATCTSQGEEHRYCEVCDEYEYRILDALGGEHNWGEWQFSWGSCVDGGEEYRTCSICNTNDYRSLTVTGEHDWGEWEIHYAATCTDEGEQYRECKNCDAYQYEEIPLVGGGHDWGEWEIQYAATCTEYGEKKSVCSRCNDTWYEEIEPTGHSFDNKVFDEVNYNWYHICDCGAAEGGKIISDSDNGVDILFPGDPEAELDVEEITDETHETYVIVEEQFGSEGIVKLYDINLVNGNGNFIQPNGTSKVKLPHDGRAGNYKVYRLNDDGTYTDMNAVVEGDKITFLANHFSYYILVDADLCTDLPESNDDVEIPDVPEIHIHEYVLSNTTDPTCTEKGVATYKCSCGSSYNVETASLGHIEITLNAVESTCFETGLTEGKGCSRCNTVLEAQNIVPMKDHVDSNEDYICDTEGCGFKFEVPKPACDCNCHKDGIAAFFFNFILFFQKLFKANQICACGEAHY